MFFLLFCSASFVHASDVFKADKYFASQQYALAKQAYLGAAKVGSPRAYYQLGVMNLKGLGQAPDVALALTYYALAAEYNFHNAQSIIDQALSSLPDESKQAFINTINAHKKQHGRAIIEKAYFPVINKDAIPHRVTFDGEPALESRFDSDDFAQELIDDFNDPDLSEEDESFVFISTPKTPFIIIDIDIAPDGTVRHHSDVQKMGARADALIKEFTHFPLAQPEFKAYNTHFIHRVYLGTAGLNRHALKQENEPLYNELRKRYRQLKTATSLKERYDFIILLRNFSWLNKDNIDVNAELLRLSQKGHPGAMYEYAMMLYREQTDIEQAIYWLFSASQFGLHRAQYRLARLLQTSPWVYFDEKKAFFWYTQALNNGAQAAKLRLADLHLTSRDKSLRDADRAATFLSDIAQENRDNPEYYYLLALSYRDRTDRNFTLVRSNLQHAVTRGDAKGWDVSGWRALLNALKTGTVISCEIVDGIETSCQK